VSAQAAPFTAVVLDSDGLSKAASGEPRARAVVHSAAEVGIPVLVSAITLTETLRGTPRDALVHRLLKGVEVISVDAALARVAGRLLGSTGRSDTVDAIVVATAQRAADSYTGRVLVVTSDPRDLRALSVADERIAVREV